MKLYGMLDSPYVRRVAISLDCYGAPFEHHPLSVFSDFEAFARINPVVKAPTLVLEDGTVLMDSNLILDHFEAQASRPLLPPRIGTVSWPGQGWRWWPAKRPCRWCMNAACGRKPSSMAPGWSA